ncbi:MAG: hypothetical protein DMG07_25790, partial [Acidobacteria bacterium]
GLAKALALFEGNYLDGPGLACYDVARDGGRFVMVRDPAGAGGLEVQVVLGWLSELRRASLAAKQPRTVHFDWSLKRPLIRAGVWRGMG